MGVDHFVQLVLFKAIKINTRGGGGGGGGGPLLIWINFNPSMYM